MSFGKFSMQAKQILSMSPMLAVIAIVSAYIYRTGAYKDTELTSALHTVELVQQQELEMVKMSEALRGYLLDPANHKEAERKQASDEAYAKYAKEMIALTAHVPDIQRITQELADFDDKVLNAKEDGVIKLIEDHAANAAEYYTKDYMPARLQQNSNFERLKSLVVAYANKTVEHVDADRLANAKLTIMILWLGLLIGVSIMVWTTISLSRRANLVFNRLNTLSGDLAGASQTLAADSAQLSEAAQSEAASIQQTMAATTQVSAMVSRNSENATLSRRASSASQEAAEAGRVSVQNMIQATTAITESNEAIMRQVDEGNRRMADITKVISEIGTKTKVINDIVFQTKLLSFNASVEAARAGEHGKGFAVVAEEVGSLAQMSGNAAREISNMLDESIARVDAIVREMRTGVEKLIAEGRQRVAEGANIAQSCGTALQSVTSSIGSLDAMVADIHSASREQATGVSEISKAMDSLSQVTSQNSLIAKQSSAAAMNIESQSQALRSSVTELIAIFRGGDAATGEAMAVPHGERAQDVAVFSVEGSKRAA